MPSISLAERTQGIFLTPGIYRGNKGYDVSLLHYQQDSGAFALLGLNVGSTTFGTRSEYMELEMGGNGWGLATMVLGVGGYRQGKRSGKQATFSMQYFLPFIFYWRVKEGITTTDEKKRPKNVEFGLIWKIPVPVIEWKGSKWNWGMSGLFPEAKKK